jgi:hypothetical protein
MGSDYLKKLEKKTRKLRFVLSAQAMRAVFRATSTTDDIGCIIQKPVEVANLIKHIEAELG